MPIFASPKKSRLLQLKQATQYLMQHIRMSGNCEWRTTQDESTQQGLLLLINTYHVVPMQEHGKLRAYFSRKLTEMGALDKEEPLVVKIRDSRALSMSMQPPIRVSSSDVAAMLIAANPPVSKGAQADRLAELRKKLAEESRQLLSGELVDDSKAGDAFQPPEDFQVTDLGKIRAR
ncbi:MAG: hypothetical protein J7549_11610 [Variovorax sp.]|nr:hypothetical protein [Variovorax sp.]